MSSITEEDTTRSGLRILFTHESFSVVFISEFLYARVDLVNFLIYAIINVRSIPQLFYDLISYNEFVL